MLDISTSQLVFRMHREKEGFKVRLRERLRLQSAEGLHRVHKSPFHREGPMQAKDVDLVIVVRTW